MILSAAVSCATTLLLLSALGVWVERDKFADWLQEFAREVSEPWSVGQ